MITIETTEPMNRIDRAVLAALIDHAPQDPTPTPNAPQAPAQTPARHSVPTTTQTGRPAFNPTQPLPQFSARQQVANQPGVTLSPAPQVTEDTPTNPATTEDNGARGDTTTPSPDDTQPQS